MATSRNSGAGTQEVRVRAEGEAARLDTETAPADTAKPARKRPARTREPKQKVRRTAPPGVYIPDRGWPKRKYALNRFFNHANSVPDINRDQWRYEKRREIKAFADQGVRPVVSLPFYKSSIKTRTATNLAAMLARCGLSVLVIPATEDPASASLGEMSGFAAGEILTLDDLVLNRHKYRRGLAFSTANKRYTKDGFMVVREGINDVRNEDPMWTVADWVEMLRIMRPHFDVVILDHANDSILKNSIGSVAVRMSDVIILPHNGSDNFSTDRLKLTFDAYKVDPYEGLSVLDIIRQDLVHMEEDPGKLMFLPGELVPTWDKMRDAIVVSGRTTEKEWTIDRVKQVLRAEQDARSSRTYEWVGAHQVIGQDSYIASNGAICDTSQLDDRTFDQFLNLAFLVMAQGSKAMLQSDQAWVNLKPELEQERARQLQREQREREQQDRRDQRLRELEASDYAVPPPPEGGSSLLAIERSSS